MPWLKVLYWYLFLVSHLQTEYSKICMTDSPMHLAACCVTLLLCRNGVCHQSPAVSPLEVSTQTRAKTRVLHHRVTDTLLCQMADNVTNQITPELSAANVCKPSLWLIITRSGDNPHSDALGLASGGY